MQADGAFTIDPSEWNIPKDSYTDLNMGAKLARWTEPGDLGRAAVANFTLDWSGDDTTEGPVIPDSLRPAVSNSNLNIYRESSEVEIGSTVRYKIDWTKFAEGTSLSEVSVRNDTLATVTINEADSDYRLKEAVIEVTGVAEGQTYILVKMSDDSIHEIPVSIIQVVEPEISVQYDNGLMLPGSTNTAMFSWTSPVDGDRIVDLTSSNEDVAIVSDSGESAVAYTLNDGTLLANVQAKAKGKATITATLQSGKSASCEVDVSDIQEGKEPTVSTGDKTFEAGATLSPEDVEGNIPVEKTDGTTEDVKVEVSVPDGTVLKAGTNTVEVTINVNGKVFTISLVITVQIPSSPTTWFTTDGANTVTGFSDEYLNLLDAPTDIVIPKSIGGSSIKTIGDSAFENKDMITSVSIPNTVTKISNKAFSGCTALERVVLPDSLSEIGSKAFYNCSSLASDIVLNEGFSKMGTSAFYGCDKLPYMYIPNSPHIIGGDCKEGKTWADSGTAKDIRCVVSTLDTLSIGSYLSQCNYGDANGWTYGGRNSPFLGWSDTWNGVTTSGSVHIKNYIIREGVKSLNNAFNGGSGSSYTTVDNLFIPSTASHMGILKGTYSNIWVKQNPGNYRASARVHICGINGVGYWDSTSKVVASGSSVSAWYHEQFCGDIVVSSSDENIISCEIDKPNHKIIVTGNNIGTATLNVYSTSNELIQSTDFTVVAPDPVGWKSSVNSDGAGVTITNYTGSDEVVTYPSTLRGLPVTAIGEITYPDTCKKISCENLITAETPVEIKGIISPSVVTIDIANKNIKLGDCDHCTLLRSVENTDGMYSISGFTGCTSLQSFVCNTKLNVSPDSENSNILSYCFSGCTSLESVDIDINSTNEYFCGSYGLFENCSSLKNLRVRGNIKISFNEISAAGGSSVADYIYTKKIPVPLIPNLDIETVDKNGIVRCKSHNGIIFSPTKTPSGDVTGWKIVSMPIHQGDTVKTVETPDGSPLFWGTNNYYWFGAESSIKTVNINSPMYVERESQTIIEKMSNVTTFNINVPRDSITGEYSKLFAGRTVNYNGD